jgi:hypothetical protein
MTSCGHPVLRFVPEPGVPFRMGREVCRACGAERLVEGDHVGPWALPGAEPSWEAQTPGSAREEPLQTG